MKQEFKGVIEVKTVDNSIQQYILLDGEELVYLLETFEGKKVKITIEEINN